MGNKRIITLGILLTAAWLVMSFRIFNIQVMKRGHYASLAQQQSVRRSIIPPQRGEIFDRNGEKLVMNAEVELEYKEGNRETTRDLKRVAPQGYMAGQVLGNIGKDGYGQMGLEYANDNVLRGTDGWKYKRFDVARKYYPGFAEEKTDPVDGLNLVISIDAHIQRVVEQALEKGVKRVAAQSGTAVVIEPYTGDVIAMASYPFYDPNQRSSADMKNWKNSVISKVYEPGSTLKIVTSSIAIEEGKLKPDDFIYAENGEYHLNGAVIQDTKAKEKITFTEALAFSSNIAMVKAALKISESNYYKYLRSFGFGMKSGISLPAEEGGKLKPVSDWSSRTQITLAWGQEIGATPLQVAMACAAVANGGNLMKPRIILEHRNSQGKTVVEFPPGVVRRVISEETADKVRTMMTAVVEYGTAQQIKTNRYSIAGKTGTAEKIDQATGQYMKGRFHSSFVGMAPADHPAYVCLVLINEPETDKYGGSCAAPVFRDIMDRMISIPGNLLAERIKEHRFGGADSSVQEKELSFAGKLMASLRGLRNPAASGTSPAAASAAPGWAGAFSSAQAKSEPGNRLEENGDQAVSEVSAFSAGERRMPDVRNLSLRDAIQQLRGMNLKIEFNGFGEVVKQEPAPNALLNRSSRCVLYLGKTG